MIKIIPYIEIDGIPTFPDSDILNIYDRIIEEGKEHIFKDGTIYGRNMFLENMKNGQTALYIIYYEKKLLGIIWLNRFEGKIARFHWCTFDEISMRKKIQVGRDALKKIMTMEDKNGNYVFDLLIGYIPAINKAAVCFVQMCGGVVCGEAPNLVWDNEKGKSEPGIIAYYQRS